MKKIDLHSRFSMIESPQMSLRIFKRKIHESTCYDCGVTFSNQDNGFESFIDGHMRCKACFGIFGFESFIDGHMRCKACFGIFCYYKRFI